MTTPEKEFWDAAQILCFQLSKFSSTSHLYMESFGHANFLGMNLILTMGSLRYSSSGVLSDRSLLLTCRNDTKTAAGVGRRQQVPSSAGEYLEHNPCIQWRYTDWSIKNTCMGQLQFNRRTEAPKTSSQYSTASGGSDCSVVQQSALGWPRVNGSESKHIHEVKKAHTQSVYFYWTRETVFEGRYTRIQKPPVMCWYRPNVRPGYLKAVSNPNHLVDILSLRNILLDILIALANDNFSGCFSKQHSREHRRPCRRSRVTPLISRSATILTESTVAGLLRNKRQVEREKTFFLQYSGPVWWISQIRTSWRGRRKQNVGRWRRCENTKHCGKFGALDRQS